MYFSCKCMIHGIKRCEYDDSVFRRRSLLFTIVGFYSIASRTVIDEAETRCFLSIQSVLNSSVSLFAVELGVHYIRAIYLHHSFDSFFSRNRTFFSIWVQKNR